MIDADKFLLSILRAAAEIGARCPTNVEIRDMFRAAGVKSGTTSIVDGLKRLTDGGEIRRRVYARNYRVIEVQTSGGSWIETAAAPPGWKPYLTVDHRGSVRVDSDAARSRIAKNEASRERRSQLYERWIG